MLVTIILSFALAPFVLEQMCNFRFTPNKRVSNWGKIFINIINDMTFNV